ncbi:MAG: iron-containing alcohol dehydrogenase, partial [Planctomycetes bacterium]|nr:iron-containing alcohol dehydrogenase [Planctomycetota bacterium]
MPQIARFDFPTDIRFGPGARTMLAEFAKGSGVAHPLLVTDSGLVKTEAFSLVSLEMKKVWGNSYASFTQVHPNPTDQDVQGAWAAYTQGKCDGVVGLGGGSALDTARAVRLKVAFPNLPLTEIPLGELPARLVPLCAIPTTAGTGSEVGRSSVITIPALGRKAIIGNPKLIADMAVLDPELTVSLPGHLTAATGMDALVHNIESLTAPIFHPMCDAIALKGIELVAQNLERAVKNPSDLEARGGMMLAAMMGAVAFRKDLGAVHSLAHPLSTECNV